MRVLPLASILNARGFFQHTGGKSGNADFPVPRSGRIFLLNSVFTAILSIMILPEKLTPSMEDYLETILILETTNRVARVKDIAACMKVQMPSVTGALRVLKTRGFVKHEKNAYISLASKGKIRAKSVFQRHEILIDFFKTALGLEG